MLLVLVVAAFSSRVGISGLFLFFNLSNFEELLPSSAEGDDSIVDEANKELIGIIYWLQL
jgi:hypothetical protein